MYVCTRVCQVCLIHQPQDKQRGAMSRYREASEAIGHHIQDHVADLQRTHLQRERELKAAQAKRYEELKAQQAEMQRVASQEHAASLQRERELKAAQAETQRRASDAIAELHRQTQSPGPSGGRTPSGY